MGTPDGNERLNENAFERVIFLGRLNKGEVKEFAAPSRVHWNERRRLDGVGASPPQRGASRVRSLEWMAVTIDRRRVDGSGRERMGSGSMRLSEAGGGRSGAFGGVQGRAGPPKISKK